MPAFSFALALTLSFPWAFDDPEQGRWPRWPTEVEVEAAPLRASDVASDLRRLNAVQALSAYRNEAIEQEVSLALGDPSPAVRRVALDLCAGRGMSACLPGAVRLWEEDVEAQIRLRALDVVGLFVGSPEGRAVEADRIVLDALRDSDELVRAHAASIVRHLEWSEDAVASVRKRLSAKLSDSASRVRQEATASLGQLGNEQTVPVLVRMLDDADPGVREASAVALGQLGAGQARPALERALERAATPSLAAALVIAVAQLEDPAVDDQLIAWMDDPPTGIPQSRHALVRAIGQRAAPSDALVDALIERMRDLDGPLRDAALSALLVLGDRAMPRVDAALAAGVEPHIRLDLERVRAAATVEVVPPVEVEQAEGEPLPLSPPPDGLDPSQWLQWAIERRGAQEQRDPMIAVAVADNPFGDRRGTFILGRLAHAAGDPQRSTHDRCLAVAALAAGLGDPASRANRPRRRFRRAARGLLDGLAQSEAAHVRACVAMALARDTGPSDATLVGLSRDPAARVRAAAVVALGARGIQSTRVLGAADRDADPRVAAAAQAVLRLGTVTEQARLLDSNAVLELGLDPALLPRVRPDGFLLPWRAGRDPGPR